jgi:putative NADPH-quinone reductase
MRVLILAAHPVAESFSAIARDVVVRTLEANRHRVDLCDLYAERFDPVLTREERLDYHDQTRNGAGVATHVERLKAADALVLVYPVWNFGFPAILKGYLDRVFLPGVSFDLVAGKVEPALTNIRRLAAVTTYGGNRLRALLVGDPPRRIVKRVLRGVTRLAPTEYHALYDMNRATEPQRRAFLLRIERSFARW